MAFEEVQGNAGGEDDREFVSAKIGAEFEGVFRGMSRRLPSKFGGEYRIVSVDLVDGRKVAIPAGKILLERIEGAGLAEGDGVKIVVESAESKAGRTYALPRLFVDREGGTAAPANATAPVEDDGVPF